jgi:hypothetical protein
VAQLHLAFGSPVTAVKADNQWEFPRKLRNFDPLSFVILELDIGKALTDCLVHARHSSVLIFSCLGMLYLGSITAGRKTTSDSNPFFAVRTRPWQPPP